MSLLAPELRLVDADAPGAPTEAESRILDAALVLVGRWGVAKTALGDVAKEAGCSRATVYRAFPGGKRHLFQSLARRELSTYLGAIVAVVDSADDLNDGLTRGLVVATRLVRDHDAAQFILDHEPGLFLPFLGFHQVDRLYAVAAASLGPRLERFLPADRAGWAAEWAARMFISYLFNPPAHVDLADIENVSALVDRYLMPALATPATATPATATPATATPATHPIS